VVVVVVVVAIIGAVIANLFTSITILTGLIVV
jgi:hypothetical protein